MLLPIKQLIGLPVKTKNGQNLGRLIEVEIETDTAEIKKYIVGADGWLKNKLAPELVIDGAQIIEINKHVITVEDSLLKGEQPAGQAV